MVHGAWCRRRSATATMPMLVSLARVWRGAVAVFVVLVFVLVSVLFLLVFFGAAAGGPPLRRRAVVCGQYLTDRNGTRQQLGEINTQTQACLFHHLYKMGVAPKGEAYKVLALKTSKYENITSSVNAQTGLLASRTKSQQLLDLSQQRHFLRQDPPPPPQQH